MEAIEVRDITKTYRAGIGRARVREMLPPPFDAVVSKLFPRWWSKNTFNALEGVSISIASGSSLGIVGHNGAGKTTLLKLIAGVTEPTLGTIERSGRIAALIDLLVGFHPDLTGRENILLFGATHGLGRKSISPRIERILDFAEIGELADTPLKRYSAGMAARLGFATITSLDADVLLVDEVLAVGDVGFQRKCMRWLDEFQDDGGTLVFVSHNLGLVRNMTERTLWLDHGKVLDDGATSQVLGRYAKAMESRDGGPKTHSRKHARKLMKAHGLDRWGIGGARVEEVHVEQGSGSGNGNEDGVDVSLRYEASDIPLATFYVGFVDEGGREIGAAASPSLPLSKGGGSVRCRIRPFPFHAGIYFPVVAIVSSDGVVRDRWKLERAIVVDRNGTAMLGETFGPVEIPADWSD